MDKICYKIIIAVANDNIIYYIFFVLIDLYYLYYLVSYNIY